MLLSTTRRCAAASGLLNPSDGWLLLCFIHRSCLRRKHQSAVLLTTQDHHPSSLTTQVHPSSNYGFICILSKRAAGLRTLSTEAKPEMREPGNEQDSEHEVNGNQENGNRENGDQENGDKENERQENEQQSNGRGAQSVQATTSDEFCSSSKLNATSDSSSADIISINRDVVVANNSVAAAPNRWALIKKQKRKEIKNNRLCYYDMDVKKKQNQFFLRFWGLGAIITMSSPFLVVKAMVWLYDID